MDFNFIKMKCSNVSVLSDIVRSDFDIIEMKSDTKEMMSDSREMMSERIEIYNFYNFWEEVNTHYCLKTLHKTHSQTTQLLQQANSLNPICPPERQYVILNLFQNLILITHKILYRPLQMLNQVQHDRGVCLPERQRVFLNASVSS